MRQDILVLKRVEEGGRGWRVDSFQKVENYDNGEDHSILRAHSVSFLSTNYCQVVKWKWERE